MLASLPSRLKFVCISRHGRPFLLSEKAQRHTGMEEKGEWQEPQRKPKKKKVKLTLRYSLDVVRMVFDGATTAVEPDAADDGFVEALKKAVPPKSAWYVGCKVTAFNCGCPIAPSSCVNHGTVTSNGRLWDSAATSMSPSRLACRSS